MKEQRTRITQLIAFRAVAKNAALTIAIQFRGIVDFQTREELDRACGSNSSREVPEQSSLNTRVVFLLKHVTADPSRLEEAKREHLKRRTI